MTEERRAKWRIYDRNKKREYRARDRKKLLIARGQCPRCGIRLEIEFERWHKTCSWYIETHIDGKMAIRQG